MDARGIIASKQQATTASRQSGTVALVSNPGRSSWAIQNLGTNVLYVLLNNGASVTNYTFALKGGSINDDGNGATLSQAEGVIYTGTVTVSGTTILYSTLET